MNTIKHDKLLFIEDCKIKNIVGFDLNLQQYYDQFGYIQAACGEYVRQDENFIGFAFYSLYGYEKYNDMNFGVRANPDDYDYQPMKHQLRTNGFDTKHFPGKVNVRNGKPINGRGRIKAVIEILKAKGIPEKDWYIPVAVVELEERQEISTGIRDNTTFIDQDPLKMEDCVTAVLAQHERGHLENDAKKIWSWLKNECLIDRVFAEQTITKIVSECEKRLDKNNKGVHIQSHDEWKDWLNIDEEKDGDVQLFRVKGNASEQFFNRHILKNLSKTNPSITKVVLYTGAKTDSQARDQVKRFCDNLKRDYRRAFKMVKNVLEIEENLKRFDTLDPSLREEKGYDTFGYELVGIIPQIDNEFQRSLLESKKNTKGSRGIDHLVSYDDYMNIK